MCGSILYVYLTTLLLIFHNIDYRQSNIRFEWSAPAQAVNTSSVNDLKNKLDAHWSNQEMVHSYRIEISGTGSRSIYYEFRKFHSIRIDGA